MDDFTWPTAGPVSPSTYQPMTSSIGMSSLTLSMSIPTVTRPGASIISGVPVMSSKLTESFMTSFTPTPTTTIASTTSTAGFSEPIQTQIPKIPGVGGEETGSVGKGAIIAAVLLGVLVVVGLLVSCVLQFKKTKSERVVHDEENPHRIEMIDNTSDDASKDSNKDSTDSVNENTDADVQAKPGHASLMSITGSEHAFYAAAVAWATGTGPRGDTNKPLPKLPAEAHVEEALDKVVSAVGGEGNMPSEIGEQSAHTTPPFPAGAPLASTPTASLHSVPDTDIPFPPWPTVSSRPASSIYSDASSHSVPATDIPLPVSPTISLSPASSMISVDLS